MIYKHIKNDPLISVIIPVYKVEKYLDRCIQSIEKQTYRNIEIILVDDGSPDNSGKIIDKWATKDRRIVPIHQENLGLSAARNTGLSNCHGDWIAFVDSDDYVSSKYIETMLKVAVNSDANLVISNYYETTMNGKIIGKCESGCSGFYNMKEFWKKFYDDDNVNTTCLTVAWNKLYSRKVFEDLRYKVGIIHEDEEILFDLIRNSQKIYIIPNSLYFYCIERTNSIMFNHNTDIESYATILTERVNKFIEIGMLNAAASCNMDLLNVSMYDYIVDPVLSNRVAFRRVIKVVRKNVSLLKVRGRRTELKKYIYISFPRLICFLKKVKLSMTVFRSKEFL